MNRSRRISEKSVQFGFLDSFLDEQNNLYCQSNIDSWAERYINDKRDQCSSVISYRLQPIYLLLVYGRLRFFVYSICERFRTKSRKQYYSFYVDRVREYFSSFLNLKTLKKMFINILEHISILHSMTREQIGDLIWSRWSSI